jgi:hypothetical protein
VCAHIMLADAGLHAVSAFDWIRDCVLSLQIPPLRIIRLLHTVSVTLSMQNASQNSSQKKEKAASTAKLDTFFISLARYVGAQALNMSSTLQLGLSQTDSCLLLQLVGTAPEAAEGPSCCISLTNDVDMSTVLESIDMSQGAPVERS